MQTNHKIHIRTQLETNIMNQIYIFFAIQYSFDILFDYFLNVIHTKDEK